jgi:hypothetical protein
MNMVPPPDAVKIPSEAPIVVPSVNPEPAEAQRPLEEAIESKQEELKRLVQRATLQFEASSSWEEFVNKSKNSQGDLHPDDAQLPHRAAHLLNRLRVRGATVATKSDP